MRRLFGARNRKPAMWFDARALNESLSVLLANGSKTVKDRYALLSASHGRCVLEFACGMLDQTGGEGPRAHLLNALRMKDFFVSADLTSRGIHYLLLKKYIALMWKAHSPGKPTCPKFYALIVPPFLDLIVSVGSHSSDKQPSPQIFDPSLAPSLAIQTFAR